ncbi:MAG: tRNA dihydrouridine synthase DusB [Methylococcales bacterium]|nr:tRNA dihydrouridine synthase DusB [Methylococcales bacterium]
MRIGSHTLKNKLILAPMAGITDQPFRNLCRNYGAGLAVSEMISSNPSLRSHRRTRLKSDLSNENGLRMVQILGTEPLVMAEAARFNQQQGADIIDINMGCPAKKVCAVAAGSALLKNESLVASILDAVVNAVDIPVTLKIRTGWDLENRNALNIAKLAENSGIAALTIHGRTRACKFNGLAEYETIKRVKQSVTIPIIANGDINSPKKAAFVLKYTNADAVMIGRNVQGQPWVFNYFQQYLKEGTYTPLSFPQMIQTIFTHLEQLHHFYGEKGGVRIARKHIGWYFSQLGIPREQTQQFYQTTTAQQQTVQLKRSFDSFLNTTFA